MEKVVKINKFSLEFISSRNNPSILIIGEDQDVTSKLITELSRHICKNQDVGLSVVFSEYDFNNVFDDKFVHPKCTDTMLKNILKYQEKYWKMSKITNKKPRKVLAILDDIEYNKKNLNTSEPVKEMLLHNRNYWIPLIVRIDNNFKLKPMLRNTFDFVFLFRDEINFSLNQQYNDFFNCSDFRTFIQLYKHISNDYGTCLVSTIYMSFNGMDNVFLHQIGELNYNSVELEEPEPEPVSCTYEDSDFEIEYDKEDILVMLDSN